MLRPGPPSTILPCASAIWSRPGDDLLQQPRVPGNGGRGECRRQEDLVERDATVGAQTLDPCRRQGGVAPCRLARRKQHGLRAGDLDLLGICPVQDRVAHRHHPPAITRAARRGVGRVERDATRRLLRQCQKHRAAGHLGCQRQRLWRVHGLGNGKRRPVRKNPAGLLDADLRPTRAAPGRGQANESPTSAGCRPAARHAPSPRRTGPAAGSAASSGRDLPTRAPC